MKLLVTGSLGFLGHHVAMHALGLGHQIIGADKIRNAISPKQERQKVQKVLGIDTWSVDLSDIKNCLALVSEKPRFDAIIHCAAQYSIPYTTQATSQYVAANLAAHTFMFEAAKVQKIQRVIYASSVAVLDNNEPSGLYGATKAYGEQCACAYTKHSGITAVGLRLGPIYGTFSRSDTHVYRALSQYLNDQRLTPHSEFTKFAPYINVKDAARIMVDFAETPLSKRHNVFLAVADEPYSNIVEVIRCAERKIGKKPLWPTDIVLPKPVQQRPDLVNLRLALGYVPGIQLQQGVEEMISWMKP